MFSKLRKFGNTSKFECSGAVEGVQKNISGPLDYFFASSNCYGLSSVVINL